MLAITTVSLALIEKSSLKNLFISNSPRFIVEAIGISFIEILAYYMILDSKGFEVIPLLGALALGAQRILPALQQAYNSYSTFIGSVPSFKDAMNLLMQPKKKVFLKQRILILVIILELDFTNLQQVIVILV